MIRNRLRMPQKHLRNDSKILEGKMQVEEKESGDWQTASELGIEMRVLL